MRDEELTAAIQEIRERVKARVPQGPLGVEGVSAADLMPLVHARDAAEAKVAAIGTVNPRPAGFVNSFAQGIKRFVARALNWHVREQVEFNRATIDCVQAVMDAMNELNRSMAALAALHQDTRAHWTEWRSGFEEQKDRSEIHVLRTISELQAAYQLRASLIEQSFRDSVKRQHDDFEGEMDRRTVEIQKRLWDDLAKVRAEYERVIHTELRLLRQRQATAAAPAAGTLPVAEKGSSHIDWLRFAETFRGSEDRIRGLQKRYVELFAGTAGTILDLGCGRGEFLDQAGEAGLSVRGIDADAECIALCRTKGLDVEQVDMFGYLESLTDGSLGGLFCSQVIEHLPPLELPRLIGLVGKKVRAGGLVAFETPNPECLEIFATHFYIDPTHTRPVPPVLLRFYLEEAGFANVEMERLNEELDYAMVAKKL